MTPQPNGSSSASGKRYDEVLGFIGWLVINGLIFWLYRAVTPTVGQVLALVAFAINIGGLILLAVRRPRMVMGALVAFGSTLVCAVLVGGVLFLQQCFTSLSNI